MQSVSVQEKQGRPQGLFSWLGGPLLERELGAHPWRGVWASMALTSLLVGGHLLHLLDLWNTRAEGYWLSRADQHFLFWGWDAFGGMLALHLLVAVAAALLTIAPTLSFMTVQREARTRTLDSLLISPMGAGGLHRGLALGSLAKVAPWVVPPALLLVAMAPLGILSMSTVLLLGALLLISAAALCSLGAALGLLLRRVSAGPLAGLLLFSALALGVGVFLIPLLSGDTMFAGLSPGAALLHTLMMDGNPWLWANSGQASMLEVSRALHVPMLPQVTSLLVMGFLGGISHHVGVRLLRDPVAPPVGVPAALASTLFVAAAMAVGCAEILPTGGYEYRGELWYSLMIRNETALVMGLVNFMALPWAFLMMLGIMPSREAQERASLWALTRPSDPPRDRQRAGLPVLVSLLLVPLAVSVLLPWTVHLPYHYTPAELGVRWLSLVPYGWGLAGLLGSVSIWRLSQRKPWQTALMLVGVASPALLGLVYGALISDSPTGRWTLVHGVALLELMEWVVLALFLATPFVLLIWGIKRRASFARRVQAHAQRCAASQEEPRDPFAWPEPREPQGALRCALRPALAPQPRRWWSPREAQAPPERWLWLQGESLELRQGAPGREVCVEPGVDLARPFSVQLSLQPREKFSHGQVMLSLVVSQKVEQGWARVGFSVPARYAGALDQIPVQEQRLDVLGPRDVQPVLAALRHFAQVHGITLPLL